MSGDFAPTRSTYASTGPQWARDLLKAETHGVQLDGDAFLARFPSGVVPSGTPVVKDGDTDLGGPLSASGEVAEGDAVVGHLVNETKVRTGSRPLQAVLHAGTVTERLLPGGSAAPAVKSALTAVVYI